MGAVCACASPYVAQIERIVRDPTQQPKKIVFLFPPCVPQHALVVLSIRISAAGGPSIRKPTLKSTPFRSVFYNWIEQVLTALRALGPIKSVVGAGVDHTSCVRNPRKVLGSPSRYLQLGPPRGRVIVW